MLHSLKDSGAPPFRIDFDNTVKNENIIVSVPYNKEPKVINYIYKEIRYYFFIYYSN